MSLLSGKLPIPPAPGLTPVLAWDGAHFAPATGLSVASLTLSGQLTSTVVTGTAPLVVASATQVANLYATRAALADTATTNADLTGVITSVGNTTSIASQTGTGTKFVVDNTPTLITPVIGAATGTSLSVSGQLTSTVVTGTAPLVVASTTNVANLNASSLSGATFSAPGAIGGGTPSTAAFTTGTYSSTLKITGATNIIGNTVWASATSQAALATFNTTALTPKAQVLGTGAASGSLGQAAFVASTAGPTHILAKSRNAAVGSYTIVQAGDTLGTVGFEGDDGAQLVRGAHITVEAAATPGSGIVPGLMRFYTADTAGALGQAMAIDPAHIVLIGAGATAGSTLFSGGTLTPAFQQLGTAASVGSANVRYNNAATTAPTVVIGHSRGAAVGTMATLVTGDTLGTFSWQGDDGTNFVEGANISAICEGTVGTGLMPGRLRFATRDAAGAAQQAMAIDSNQVIILGSSSGASSTATSALFTGGTLRPTVQLTSNSSTDAAAIFAISCYRATSARTPWLTFAKSASNTLGTMTVVPTGYNLGGIDFQGADGTNFVSAARILVSATGTPAAGVMPGNMVFQVTNTGGVQSTALTIANDSTFTVVGFSNFTSSVDASAIGTASVVMSGGLSVAKKLYLGSDFNFTDAKNFVLGSTTGNKFGTATSQKIGFWNATPVIQPAGATQAAPAAYATGVFGLDSTANMQALYDLVVAMRTALVNTGIMKGAA